VRLFLRSVAGGVLLAATLAGSAASLAGDANGATASGQYIVVLKDGAASPAQIAAEHGRAYGFKPQLVYGHALRGYAARLPEAALAGITSRPEVRFVSEDREVRAAQTQPPQAVSFGVLRIDGDKSSTRSGDGKGSVNINVAVIDDGIDVDHPDLNVRGLRSCLRSDRQKPDPFGDARYWHGTMAGGFIGALDNAIGRVGVAPGARLWGVRSLDDSGRGFNSEIICGLDWVLSTRTDGDPTNDIDVVNMSLGGPPGDDTGSCPASAKDAFHAAHCSVIAAGITIVAAAGNDAADLQEQVPAAYDDVLAVTAITDLDGKPGGLQPPTGECSSQLNQFGPVVDDSAAFFSNFATLPEDQTHTVAAPGVCIASTYPGGLYVVASGTSFSSPLVAGTVALCIASGPCAGLAPRQIIEKIVSDAASYNTARKNSGYGFDGDPLRPASGKYFGYLVRAGLY
jgi:subtilisin